MVKTTRFVGAGTNRNGTEPKFPWDICPPPTADTSLAVIPFGVENALVVPFYTCKRLICQDRLGTNIGNVENDRCFLQANSRRRSSRWTTSFRRTTRVRKTDVICLHHFILVLSTISLPRPAQDKHRKKLRRKGVSRRWPRLSRRTRALGRARRGSKRGAKRRMVPRPAAV